MSVEIVSSWYNVPAQDIGYIGIDNRSIIGTRFLEVV
jgi:hypothetical protein